MHVGGSTGRISAEMLHDNMDLERLMVHAQQVEKGHRQRRVYESMMPKNADQTSSK